MKFFIPPHMREPGQGDFREELWGDHRPLCKSGCQEVDIERSATFVRACAEGSALLMEELKKRQAPVVREKAKQVEKWAQQTGVFHEFDKERAKSQDAVKRITVYAGENNGNDQR